MKGASDEDDILSFFPVSAPLHTFLTVCLNFSNFLIVKGCKKKNYTKFGSFETHTYHIFGCGGYNEQESDIYFWKFSTHFKTPIDRLNQ